MQDKFYWDGVDILSVVLHVLVVVGNNYAIFLVFGQSYSTQIGPTPMCAHDIVFECSSNVDQTVRASRFPTIRMFESLFVTNRSLYVFNMRIVLHEFVC